MCNFYLTTVEVCENWPRYCVTYVKGGMSHASWCVCVCMGMQFQFINTVCVSHKLQTQWLDWCNDSSNEKYSSGDCSGSKTINACMRFIKCNPCTEQLHLGLFHHSVLKLGEVLHKHRLIESIGLSSFKQIFLQPSASVRHRCDPGNRKKNNIAQTLSSTEEPNPANHVWVSWLFFHFLSSYQK